MIVTGLDAAVLAAEMEILEPRRKGYITPFKKIYWEDAPQKLKDNPEIVWMSSPSTLLYGPGEKYTLVRQSDKEKEEAAEIKRNVLKKRIAFLLNKYGYEAAEFYVEARADEFKKVNYKVNFNQIPRCIKNTQCDFRCGYYNPKGCTYKGDFDANNL